MVKKAKSIQPERISGGYPKFKDKSIYGGKASSLYTLMNKGYSVPVAWVIPCEYCATQPEIDLSPITESNGPHALFAVRSGAPVSMPGLLQTKLNVPTTKLEKAIKEVWESWNTEHAKLYRNAKGLDDSMGTAVIIQKMVKAKYAGVAFTCDPNSDPSDKTYNPIVEYVKGLADKLVSGEVTPTKADLKAIETDEFNMLGYYLDNIHKSFGPSDVEWCIDKDSNVYFVQQRALRYAQSSTQESVEGKKLLTKGKAIGAPVQVTAIVKTPLNSTLTEDDAVYVEHFLPEYYPIMMKAAAIITQSGGETCHASIIARELNKPAISGLSEGEAVSDGLPVFIDGATGCIYEADPVVGTKKKKKLVAAFKKADFVLSETRVPNQDIVPSKPKAGNRYDLNHIVARFYYNLDQFHKGNISVQRKDQIVQEVADIVAIYLYRACLGEMRHLRASAHQSITRDALALKMEEALGWEISLESHQVDRNDWVKQVKQPSSIKEAVDIMTIAHACFCKPQWSSSYGGKKWGNIANTLLNYLRGIYSPTLFADTCFNLVHNGGCAFGKFPWLFCCASGLQQELHAKQAGDMTTLLQYATYEISTDISAYIAKESILLGVPAHAAKAAA